MTYRLATKWQPEIIFMEDWKVAITAEFCHPRDTRRFQRCTPSIPTIRVRGHAKRKMVQCGCDGMSLKEDSSTPTDDSKTPPETFPSTAYEQIFTPSSPAENISMGIIDSYSQKERSMRQPHTEPPLMIRNSPPAVTQAYTALRTLKAYGNWTCIFKTLVSLD